MRATEPQAVGQDSAEVLEEAVVVVDSEGVQASEEDPEVEVVVAVDKCFDTSTSTQLLMRASIPNPELSEFQEAQISTSTLSSSRLLPPHQANRLKSSFQNRMNRRLSSTSC